MAVGGVVGAMLVVMGCVCVGFVAIMTSVCVSHAVYVFRMLRSCCVRFHS